MGEGNGFPSLSIEPASCALPSLTSPFNNSSYPPHLPALPMKPLSFFAPSPVMLITCMCAASGWVVRSSGPSVYGMPTIASRYLIQESAGARRGGAVRMCRKSYALGREYRKGMVRNYCTVRVCRKGHEVR